MCKHSKWHNYSRIIYDVKGNLSYKYEWILSTNVFALYFIEDSLFNLTNYNIELSNKIIIRMLSFIFATLRETQTINTDFRMRKKKTKFLPVCLNTVSRTLTIHSRILNFYMNFLFMHLVWRHQFLWESLFLHSFKISVIQVIYSPHITCRKYDLNKELTLNSVLGL